MTTACRAQVFPPWAYEWVQCGSPIVNGQCTKYGHPTGLCCDLHGRTCEPPSELCCRDCTEAAHPHHADGSTCSSPDLSGNTLTRSNTRSPTVYGKQDSDGR